jgi:energy-coupling factor transport system ATP-binding protein
MVPVVSIKDLSWKYEGRNQFALRDISLDIEENSFLSVVGPNEAGKTTLVSCIKGLIPHSFHGVLRGMVEVFGKDIRKKSGLELAREVGFVFSDPEAQFTSMTVEEELVFAMENVGFSLQEIQERLEWVTEITMIKDLLDKSPYEISGGQKQRVAIASVMALKPRIIILDEPTSMLDPLGKDFIFEILETLKRQEALTLIVVEHNIEQIAPLSDMMALIVDGELLKVAPPEEFFSDLEFLERYDVYAPQVTAFASWLQEQRLYSGPLPLEVDQAAALCKEVLERGRGS